MAVRYSPRLVEVVIVYMPTVGWSSALETLNNGVDPVKD